MQVSSFPDILKFSNLHFRGAELKRDVVEAYEQLTTGRKSREDTIRDTGGRLGDAHLALKELERIERQEISFNQGLTRSSLVETSLDLILNSVGSLPETLSSGVGREDQNIIDAAALEASAALENVVSALNVQQGRRYLFSGDAVTTPPIASAQEIISEIRNALTGLTTAADVDTALDAFFADGGTFDTTLYTGGTGDASGIEISDGDRVRIETRADNDAFKEMIRGLGLTALFDELSFEPEEFELVAADASTHMVSGIDSTSKVIAQTGLAANRIESAMTRNQAEEAVFTDAYNAFTAVDPYEAATRAQELEIQLETTYNVTSRLAALSFNNFLR